MAFHLLAPALGSANRVRLICREDKLERLFAELAIHKIDLVIADRPLPSQLGVKGYNYTLGRASIAFYSVHKLAVRYRKGFPQSGAPMLPRNLVGLLSGARLVDQIFPNKTQRFSSFISVRAGARYGRSVTERPERPPTESQRLAPQE